MPQTEPLCQSCKMTCSSVRSSSLPGWFGMTLTNDRMTSSLSEGMWKWLGPLTSADKVLPRQGADHQKQTAAAERQKLQRNDPEKKKQSYAGCGLFFIVKNGGKCFWHESSLEKSHSSGKCFHSFHRSMFSFRRKKYIVLTRGVWVCVCGVMCFSSCGSACNIEACF